MPTNKKYRVLLTDLDGTLIDTSSGNAFPTGVADMRLKFDVIEAIRKMQPEIIYVVSNQGGIASGFVDEMHFQCKLHYIFACLEELTGCKRIDGDYCATNDKSDAHRKPNTAMIDEFLRTWNLEAGKTIDKAECLMIGDASGKPGDFSDSDKQCAENAGIDYLDVNDFVAYNW